MHIAGELNQRTLPRQLHRRTRRRNHCLPSVQGQAKDPAFPPSRDKEEGQGGEENEDEGHAY